MAKFNLNENEKVLAEFKQVEVFANDLEYKVELILLTNQRIALLFDANKDLDYVNIFRARGMDFNTNYELSTDFKLDEIKEIIYKDDMNHITFKDTNNILDIFCEDLNKYLK